jgi:hypothetical protein
MDELVLLGAFQLGLVLLIAFSRRTKRQKAIHVGILVAYCLLFYWLIFFRGNFGSSLLWMFYLAVLTLAHLIWILVAPVFKKA